MCHPRIIELAEEIRNLHARKCEYADRLLSNCDRDAQKLKRSFKAPDNPSIPELQYFLTIFDRHDALQKAQHDPQIRRRTKLAMILNWIAVFAGCLIALTYWDSLIVLVLAGVLIGGFLVILENRFLFRTQLQRCLREQLLERGVPICLVCGYDLRGQIDPRCPECGTPCTPSILNAAKES